MAYTHGSNTGTHGRVRTQGHSNGDELTLTGKLLYSVYAGVLHAGALSRPGYSGLGLGLVIVVAAVVVAAVAALAAAAGVLGIPKYCVADFIGSWLKR